MNLTEQNRIFKLRTLSSRQNIGPIRAFKFVAVWSIVLTVSLPGNTLREDAPIAVDDQARTVQKLPVTIPVLANDRDAESNQLAILRVTPPAPHTRRRGFARRTAFA